ncbi:MAG: sulfotransferase domain-containing protein [Thermodesulfovibrionales bacterium]
MWVLTEKRRILRDADAVVISVPKCGRTWLRVMANKYFSIRYGVPFELGDMGRLDSRVPSIIYTHERWEHTTDVTWSGFLSRRYLIPDRVLSRKKVVVLYRDPRDVEVSLFFQVTRRNERRPRAGMDMAAFLRDRRYGIEKVVRMMNLWRRRFRDHPACLWLSYEEMKADPRGALAKFLEFVGEKDPRRGAVEEAVDFSRFENMRRMEAEKEFQGKILRPADPSDPDSFKVRKGKVGGHVDHFSPEDRRYAARALSALDPFYGYGDARAGGRGDGDRTLAPRKAGE